MIKKYYKKFNKWVSKWKYHIVVFGTTGVLLTAAVVMMFIQIGIYVQTQNMIVTYRAKANTTEQTLKTGLEKAGQTYTDTALRTFFTLPELTYVMSQYWAYGLTVNGQKLSSGSITVPAGKVTLTLREDKKTNIFPQQTVVAGRVTGGDKTARLSNYLTVSESPAPSVTKINDTTTEAVWNIAKATSGKSYTVNLSPMLMQKLGVSFSSVVIKVK